MAAATQGPGPQRSGSGPERAQALRGELVRAWEAGEQPANTGCTPGDSLARDGPLTGSAGADDTSGEHVTMWNTQPGRQESQRGVSVSLQGQVTNAGLPCGRPVPGLPRWAGQLGPRQQPALKGQPVAPPPGLQEARGSGAALPCSVMLVNLPGTRWRQEEPFNRKTVTRHPRPPGAAFCWLCALPLRTQ